MNVVIRYDGVDITADVLVTEAVFISQVNGTPGTCKFTVRDPARDKVFVTGKELRLEIDGVRVWLGFATAVRRVYAFDAQDVDPVDDITRLIAIEGVDINVLFRRRYLLKKASPTHLEGPTYPVATADTMVISDMILDWLDLSSDGLDTSSLVTHVGNVNIDQKAQPFAGSMNWEEAMRTVARITGAVFYLNPSRKLVYVDVDTPTAPFALSDTPSGSDVGYREMTILSDGADLVNDVLAIGAGGGSRTPVAVRQQDAASIAAHGRWQMGTLHTGVYKQASIDKIADSIINGSPLSKRGHKDDKLSIQVSVFEPGLQPAHKVSFISDVFGYSDVLPIRRMEITFPTPTDARYRLTLGHDIDQPFDPFDPVNYRWPGFDFHFPGIPGWHVPPADADCVEVPGGPPAICGMADDFERAAGDLSGSQSSTGYGWSAVNDTAPLGGWYLDGHNAVVDAKGRVETSGPGSAAAQTRRHAIFDLEDLTTFFPFDMTIKFSPQNDADQIKAATHTGSGGGIFHVFGATLTVFGMNIGNIELTITIGYGFNDTTGIETITERMTIVRTSGSNPPSAPPAYNFPSTYFHAGATYYLRFVADATGIHIGVGTGAVVAFQIDWPQAAPFFGPTFFANGVLPDFWAIGQRQGRLRADLPVAIDAIDVITKFDYIDVIDHPPCVGGSGTDCLPASGFVCEDLVIAGSPYLTSGSYRAGTLEVYVNGTVQRPGVDYAELDPVAGSFTMTTAPTEGLRACYDRVTSDGGYPAAPISRSS